MHIRLWHAVALVTAATCILLGPAASAFMAHRTLASGEPGYEDISPGEAHELLTDSTTVEIPIDVRTDWEWQSERIDTPHPEFPRHFILSRLEGQEGMETFKARYAGATVILYCRSGARSSTAAGLLDAADFNGTVYNMQGGITAWKDAGYPTKTGNTAPDTPATPEGPAAVHAGDIVTYTSSAVDPDGDPLRLGWDWDGDDTVDSWTDYRPPSMQVNTSHVWQTAGSYTLQVAAEDHVGDLSGFASLDVVVDNAAPEPPGIAGPASGTTGEPYNYTFTLDDQDGDQVYLWVEWSQDCPAEGWLGPFDSGETATLKHVWNESGTYLVKAKAKDTVDMESDWATMEVTMPLSHRDSMGWSLWKYVTAWVARITGNELFPPF